MNNNEPSVSVDLANGPDMTIMEAWIETPGPPPLEITPVGIAVLSMARTKAIRSMIDKLTGEALTLGWGFWTVQRYDVGYARGDVYRDRIEILRVTP